MLSNLLWLEFSCIIVITVNVSGELILTTVSICMDKHRGGYAGDTMAMNKGVSQNHAIRSTDPV